MAQRKTRIMPIPLDNALPERKAKPIRRLIDIPTKKIKNSTADKKSASKIKKTKLRGKKKTVAQKEPLRKAKIESKKRGLSAARQSKKTDLSPAVKERAITTLVQLMESGSAAVRLSAARCLLDRIWGRPSPQQVAGQDAESQTIRAKAIAEARALLQELAAGCAGGFYSQHALVEDSAATAIEPTG